MRNRSFILVVAALIAAGLVSVVLAQGGPPPGKWEVTDAGKSWPHENKYSGEPHNGKSAADLLTQMHDAALAALATEQDPEKKANMARVVTATLTCLAFDGNFAVSNPPPPQLPAHHSTCNQGSTAAHAAAKAKVLLAHAHAFPTAGPADWGMVAQELEHGH